jgi:hypothetical protein
MSNQKVLLISGCKQSGKSSAMNYLAGYLLKSNGMSVNNRPMSMFQLNDKGGLEIDYYSKNPSTGEEVVEWAELDITRKDGRFVEMASQVIYPIIKVNSFADHLKEVAIVLFKLKRDEVYGTDEQKNNFCNIRWEDVYKLLPDKKPKKARKKKDEEDPVEQQEERPEFLTNRQFLEILGTDIFRALYDNCWIDATFSNIIEEEWPFVVVTDCRFRNELEFGRQINGLEVKCVRLTRNPFNGTHAAETDFNGYDNFDAVIDNVNMTQEEKGAKLVEILQSWGWIV